MLIAKIGGNIIDDAVRLQSFLQSFAALPLPKLLVHGGGKVATALGTRMGIEAKMVEGRRITDAETLNLVTMVYGGLVNKQIVAKLQALGCNALGLSGADANVIKASKRPAGTIDYGFAGDLQAPQSINTGALAHLLEAGISPVFAPLTHDGQGQLLNTNADTIAATLAAAFASSHAVKLVYLFEKPGVLQDATDDSSVIHSINRERYTGLKSSGAIHAGMVPKLDNAFDALASGVEQVLICQAEEIDKIGTPAYGGTILSSN